MTAPTPHTHNHPRRTVFFVAFASATKPRKVILSIFSWNNVSRAHRAATNALSIEKLNHKQTAGLLLLSSDPHADDVLCENEQVAARNFSSQHTASADNSKIRTNSKQQIIKTFSYLHLAKLALFDAIHFFVTSNQCSLLCFTQGNSDFSEINRDKL
jgi:hypothetical protein